MSPTVLRVSGYRFYFFSREEPRARVHVQHADGEAKFWLEPEVGLAQNYELSARQLAPALRSVRKHKDENRAAWEKHFGGRDLDDARIERLRNAIELIARGAG